MASEDDAMVADPPSNGAVVAADASKGLVARPVPLSGTGKGLPYAPEDWPSPGDNWKWRVGRRISQTGYFLDRFLYPPARLDKGKSASQRTTLCSKSALEQFIRKNVPGTNMDALLASFIWRIPSRHANIDIELQSKSPSSSCSRFQSADGRLGSKLAPRYGECKAGNSLCQPGSRTRKDSFPIMDCDICHSENDFCHDCCCILCCKTIDWAYVGYSFIICEAIVDGRFICGHIAHLDCALRAYMAGTVTGSLCLNAEYYCRRCDNKTDLVTYLTKLLSCNKYVNSHDETEKFLNMGLCILRDSDRYDARKLLALIESMFAKFRDGVNLEEVWKLEDDISTTPTDNITMLGTHNGAVYSIESREEIRSSVQPKHLQGQSIILSVDHHMESLVLENKIDEVLLKLKHSQEWEYNLAEEKLYAQRDVILGLYEDLRNLTCDSFGDTADQILREQAKLDSMLRIARGFGVTPKPVLQELFGLQIHE